MRVLCIDDHWDATNGFLGIGGKPKRKIKGITEGKEYFAMPINKISGGGHGSLGVSNDIQFLVFNDSSKWELYPLDCFAPTS